MRKIENLVLFKVNAQSFIGCFDKEKQKLTDAMFVKGENSFKKDITSYITLHQAGELQEFEFSNESAYAVVQLTQEQKQFLDDQIRLYKEAEEKSTAYLSNWVYLDLVRKRVGLNTDNSRTN